MNNFYSDIMEGLNDSLAHAKGIKKLRTHKVVVKPARDFTAEDVKLLRHKLGFTQNSFASIMNVSPKTIEAWEKGTNTPAGSAKRLLGMISDDSKCLAKHKIISNK